MLPGTELTKEQLQILRHTIGADDNGFIRHERNSFVTDISSKDGKLCQSLVRLGLMEGSAVPLWLGGGMTYFTATYEGRMAIVRTRPKRTAGQSRYQQFLDEEPNCSFGEWLKQLKNRRRA